MNKRKSSVLLVFVLLIVTGFWLQQNKEKPPIKQIKTPNTVTLKSELDLEKVQKESNEKLNATHAHYKNNWLQVLGERIPKPLEQRPSYLAAYRDFRYFTQCFDILSSIAIGYSPHYLSLDSQEHKFDSLSDAQKANFEQRLYKCQDLTHEVTEIPLPEHVSIKLKERFQNITPKTNEEKALELVLNFIDEFKQTSGRLNNLKLGQYINIDLYFELNNQRRALKQQYPQRTSIFGGFSEADKDLVAQLDKQLVAIEEQIENNRQYDQNEIAAQQTKLDNLAQQLLQTFYTASYPDVLLAVHDFFTDNRYNEVFDEYETQYGKTILPSTYGAWLEQAVTHFRACELGYPCDSDSEITERLCLDLLKVDAPKACNKAVLDHYINNLLSENQLMDVETLLKEWFS